MPIDEWLARVGVGAAVLTMQLESDTFSRGTVIEGTLTLEGGAVEQHIEQLLVRLSEYHQAGKSSHWEELGKGEVIGAITIAPGEVQQYPFAMPVPARTRMTTQAGFYDKSTQITADADILWAINPRAQMYVTIAPEPEFMLLDTAMRRLGFASPTQRFDSIITPALFQSNEFIGKVQKTYTAPTTLQQQITDATLLLYIEDGHVCGSLLLNHREERLADYLKAMVGGDKEVFPLQIPRGQLQGPQSLETATAIIQEMLEQTLILPDNEKRWLLRASDNPHAGADSLLRPAAPNPETHAHELLHPASPDQTDQEA